MELECPDEPLPKRSRRIDSEAARRQLVGVKANQGRTSVKGKIQSDDLGEAWRFQESDGKCGREREKC